jgi:hypothetical protein
MDVQLTVALFPSELLMDTVSIDDYGNVLSGHVINGDWAFKSNLQYGFAYLDSYDLLCPKRIWSLTPQRLVIVPSSHDASDYNSTLQRFNAHLLQRRLKVICKIT